MRIILVHLGAFEEKQMVNLYLDYDEILLTVPTIMRVEDLHDFALFYMRCFNHPLCYFLPYYWHSDLYYGIH